MCVYECAHPSKVEARARKLMETDELVAKEMLQKCAAWRAAETLQAPRLKKMKWAEIPPLVDCIYTIKEDLPEEHMIMITSVFLGDKMRTMDLKAWGVGLQT